MFAFAGWLLHWARSHGHRFFLQFGLHCATHQTRVILISCVVITSLLYPALDLYTSSRTSSQSILDALLSPSSLNPELDHDLLDIWSPHDTISVHEDPVSRAKCQNGNTLRLERILIQSSLPDDDWALNNKILLATYSLQQRLQDQLDSTPDLSCLKQPGSQQCFVVSPLAFWHYDKAALTDDSNILDTIGYSNNASVAGLSITPQMVLAGRGSYEHHVGAGNKFDYASFLALTYFFPHNPCWESANEHTQWTQMVESAVGQKGQVSPSIPESSLIALELNPHRLNSRTKEYSAISACLYLAYVGFFAYVGWSVRRMDGVHSRIGVGFTALVEIAVSTITSLSVCALVGFKITMVPWELLPIVIVFVGAENMFNLVDAVVKTSVTLSVKQRIAEGLSRAGTSNTLKVVSYNAILGVIAALSVGAVRQFCAFAVVVLVAHWFLAHTFFMAVLSIDIARLELEELLRHDTSLVPSASSSNASEKENTSLKQPRKGWRKLIFTVQSLLKGRAATNISLLMLLAIAATLYYTTYTASTSHTLRDAASMRKPFGAIARSNGNSPASLPPMGSAAEQIWKILNPEQTSDLLHLRIGRPTTVTFTSSSDDPTDASGTRTHSKRSKYTMRTAKFVLWLLTIMVLPIAGTTSALYGLLLYLLKNTELLEAQRHKIDGDPVSQLLLGGLDDNKGGLDDKVSFETLPRAIASDIELIGSSKGGKIIVSVGLRNEIVVWDAEAKRVLVKVEGSEVLARLHGKMKHAYSLSRSSISSSCSSSSSSSSSSLGGFSETITSLIVDEEGKYFALGTGTGVIVMWKIDRVRGVVRPFPVMSLDGRRAGVTDMKFVEELKLQPKKSKSKVSAPPPPGAGLGASSSSSEPSSPEGKQKKKGVSLLATYDDGIAVRWTTPSTTDHPTVSYYSPSRNVSVARAFLVPVLPDERVLIAFSQEDGSLDLVETGEYPPTLLNECVIQAGEPYDPVSNVHACRAVMAGSTRFVIAVSTEAGAVSLWDGLTAECISILEEPLSGLAAGGRGLINQLRVSPVQCETCHFCGQLPVESLSIAFSSTDNIVRLARLYLADQTYAALGLLNGKTARRCSCARAQAHLQSAAATSLGVMATNGGLKRVDSRDNLAAGKRSRSNSSAAMSASTSPSASTRSSPLIPRARLATAFEPSPSAFPVSGHGVHSRRASEKEPGGRRSTELLTVPVPFPGSLTGAADDYEADSAFKSGSATPTQTPFSLWKHADILPLVDITCERGGWDISGNVFIGVRRKPRSQAKPKAPLGLNGASSQDGLTTATLERWEMWSFDPRTASMQRSLLASLPSPSSRADGSIGPSTTKSKNSNPSTYSFSPRTKSSLPSTSSSSSPGDSIARLPFTRASPSLIAPSHAVVGFGNTIGVFHLKASSSTSPQ